MNALAPRQLVALLFASGVVSSFANAAEEAAHTFTSVDIGDIMEGSTVEVVSGRDFEIRGFGQQFGLHADSDTGRFVYTKLTGDFDITVKVRAVENEDQSFAEVGLLARADLTPGGLETGMFVSNNFYGEQDQYTFIYRVLKSGSIEPFGNRIPGYWGPGTLGSQGFGYSAKGWAKEYPRPRPFPYVWLRLIRTGDTFRGLRREYLDSWEVVGIHRLELPAELYVGMAISANHHSRKSPGAPGDPAVATNVSFRDLTIKQ